MGFHSTTILKLAVGKMASKFSITDVQDDVAPASQTEEDVSEGELRSATSVNYTIPFLPLISPAGYSPRLFSDSVKVAIEGRSEEQQADTITPLISWPVPTDANAGEVETGNLALYEVCINIWFHVLYANLALALLYVCAYVRMYTVY